MFNKRNILIWLLVLCLMLSGCTQDVSENGSNPNKGSEPNKVTYPKETITIIAPYAAGGSVDILSRTLSDYLTNSLGQPVIVINKPGGGGSVGTAEAARAKADGYTLVVVSNGGLIVNPYATDVGYTYNDLTPVSMLTEVPIGIGVNANSEFETLDDLIQYAKNNPNKVRYATPGANSTPHLTMEELGSQTGVLWNHMPNGSSPQAMAELLGGHIEVFTVNVPTFKANYDAKTVKILAMTGDERNSEMPDVPTLKELGYDIPLSVWFGVLAPKDLPEDINKILNEQIKKACEDPTIIEEWQKIQMPATYINTEEFTQKIKDDDETLKEILKSMGMIE